MESKSKPTRLRSVQPKDQKMENDPNIKSKFLGKIGIFIKQLGVSI